MSSDSLFYALLAVAGFLLVRSLILARPTVGLEEARVAVAAGTAVIIDVREPPEWAGGVVRDAALLPLSDLRGARRQWRTYLEDNRGRRLYFYCHSGTRSGVAARLLAAEGFQTANLGAFSRWAGAGLPVRRPA